MKLAKKLFAILFLAVFLIYGGNNIFNGMENVSSAIWTNISSGDAMEYAANSAGFSAMPVRTDFLESHAKLQNLLGKTESGGFDVIAANDGAFVTATDGSWDRWDIEQYAVSLYKLDLALAEAGMDTEVLFISAQPQIINEYTVPLRDFPLPDQSQLTETMLYYLRSYNVDFLDTYQSLERTTLDVSEYIYKTDSRWTTQASLLTAQALVGKMKDQFGEEVDTAFNNMDNFTYTTYEDTFLGNMGMRAGEQFTGREDFMVITPRYDTDFIYRSISGDAEAQGTFEEVLINLNNLQPTDPYVYSTYAVYMNGGADYHRVIINNNQPESPKALFIHDSSGVPFAAFTALNFSETHMYWPAIAEENDSFNVQNYVIENDIDYVFFLSEGTFYALEGLFGVSIETED